MSAARTRKAEKLRHYAARPLKTFVQLDGFNDGPDGGFEYEDTDGDELWSTSTDELMRGSTVRVLIDPKAEPAVVARLLTKLAAWWARDGVDLGADALEFAAAVESERLPPGVVSYTGPGKLDVEPIHP